MSTLLNLKLLSFQDEKKNNIAVKKEDAITSKRTFTGKTKFLNLRTLTFTVQKHILHKKMSFLYVKEFSLCVSVEFLNKPELSWPYRFL